MPVQTSAESFETPKKLALAVLLNLESLLKHQGLPGCVLI